jgi:hypothetical protein
MKGYGIHLVVRSWPGNSDRADDLLPRVPPHVRIPAAFVHFNEIEIGDHAAVVLESVLLDHLGNEPISLIIAPAAFAHEAVVDQDLFRGEAAAILHAPTQYFLIRFAGEHLLLHGVVLNGEITARATIEALAEHLEIFLREFACGVETNLRAHPREVEHAAGLFVTAFDAFNFHSVISGKSRAASESKVVLGRNRLSIRGRTRSVRSRVRSAALAMWETTGKHVFCISGIAERKYFESRWGPLFSGDRLAHGSSEEPDFRLCPGRILQIHNLGPRDNGPCRVLESSPNSRPLSFPPLY